MAVIIDKISEIAGLEVPSWRKFNVDCTCETQPWIQFPALE
jgi:hypothetical protein